LDIDDLFKKTSALEDLDKYNEQIQCYNEILEVEPKNTDAFYDMGLCRANLGKYENVIEFWNIVLTREPNPTDTLYNKALTLENFR
jgi:tetratricopeptide (TPR) repeat protein